MPVRSLTSSVFKWPDAKTVNQAIHLWAQEATHHREGVPRIGYFGSYARGNWGVRSDLDIIIILDHTDQPFERRQLEWDTIELPVPCDLLVYTREEWVNLAESGSHFYHRLNNEVIWVYEGKL